MFYCSGSMCVGVTLWFGWGGVVSLCRLQPAGFSLHKDTTPPSRRGESFFPDFWFQHEVCLETYPRKKKRNMTVIYYTATSNGAWQVERSLYTFMRWSKYRSVNIISGQPVVFLPDTAHFVTSFNRKQCLASFFTAHQLVRLKFVTV